MGKVEPTKPAIHAFASSLQSIDEERQMNLRLNRRALYFSIPVSLLIVTTSLGGLLFDGVHTLDTIFAAAQATAQDFVNLVAVVPLLIITSILIKDRKGTALLVWLGTMIYVVHSFAIYCFAVSFNALFLGYCMTLGLSVYGIQSVVADIDMETVPGWFDVEKLNELTIAYLWILVIFFSSEWLKVVAAAIIGANSMADVRNPEGIRSITHALDLSIFLPGTAIAAVLLRRRRPRGYIFAPAMLVFFTLYEIEMASTVVSLRNFKQPVNSASFWLFAALVVFSYLILHDFLTHVKT